MEQNARLPAGEQDLLPHSHPGDIGPHPHVGSHVTNNGPRAAFFLIFATKWIARGTYSTNIHFQRRDFTMQHLSLRVRFLPCWLWTGIALAGLTPAAHADFSFVEIPGIAESIVKMSSDGATIVGAVRTNGLTQAARWNAATGTVLLGSLRSDGHSYAYGVSADGRYVVGQSESANGIEAILWSSTDGLRALGDLPGGGLFHSAAFGVSDDGSIVIGQSGSAGLQRAIRWRSGIPQDLGNLGAGGSSATAVSPDGSVVIGSSLGSFGLEAFRWTAASGMTGLGALPQGGRTHRAHGLSPDGNVIVGIGINSSFEAFRWTPGGTIELGTFAPTNPGSSASAVSADGKVIVGMGSGVDADGNGEAFVWFPARGILDLRKYLLDHGVTQVLGWRISEATSVSLDGRILGGWGVNPQGQRAAWIAHIDIDDSAPPPIALTPPAAPSGLVTAATATQVTLQWQDGAANEQGFKIERCEGNGCNTFAQVAQVGANVRQYVDTRRNRNTVYRYRVRAFNAAGHSPYSNTVSVRTPKK